MRIGIYGGSFNPIHTGHAIIASHVMSNSDLDALWLMVSPHNPLKPQQYGVSDRDRLMMTERVSRLIEGVETSAFEFELPRPSYTIDTLDALHERFPQHEFVLLIGADNWAVWQQWKDHERIVSDYEVMIYPRRGFDVVIPPECARRVHMIDAPLIELSSTMIRERIGRGESIEFYVPTDVALYINSRHLYRTEAAH